MIESVVNPLYGFGRRLAKKFPFWLNTVAYVILGPVWMIAFAQLVTDAVFGLGIFIFGNLIVSAGITTPQLVVLISLLHHGGCFVFAFVAAGFSSESETSLVLAIKTYAAVAAVIFVLWMIAPLV